MVSAVGGGSPQVGDVSGRNDERDLEGDAGLVALANDAPDLDAGGKEPSSRLANLKSWFSPQEWTKWALNGILNGVIGSPEILQKPREHLPSSACYLSQIIGQLGCEGIEQREGFQQLMEMPGVDNKEGPIWAGVDADKRMRVALENVALTIEENILERLEWLDAQADRADYSIVAGRSLLKVFDRHMDEVLKTLAQSADGELSWDDWRSQLGAQLHPAFDSLGQVSEVYFWNTSQRIIDLGLPGEAEELHFLSAAAQVLLYQRTKAVLPMVLKSLADKLGERKTVNRLLLNGIWKINSRLSRSEWPSESVQNGEDRESDAVAMDGRLNRRVGAIVSKVARAIYPRLGGFLFGVFNLETFFGGLLGRKLSDFLGKAGFVELCDDLLNESLATLCQGTYVRDPHGRYRFEPQLVPCSHGSQDLVFRQVSNDGAEGESLQETVERELTLLIRKVVPLQLVRIYRKWRAGLDRGLTESLPYGLYLVKARRRFGGFLLTVGRGLAALLHLDRAVDRVTYGVFYRVSMNILNFCYQPGHRNLLLKLQDTLLDILERDEERWKLQDGDVAL